METLRINNIKTDGGTQVRAFIDQGIVDEYAEAMEGGAEFPPAVVFYDGSDYWLADGFHRLRASEQIGLVGLDCEVNPGTRRDAILHAVGANEAHGFRRSNADKRRAVLSLLNDDEWAEWSDNRIAEVCRVHQTTVSRARASLMQSDSEPPATRTYTTKHGTTATMNTAKIGKTPQPRPKPKDAVPREELLAEARENVEARNAGMATDPEFVTIREAYLGLSDEMKVFFRRWLFNETKVG